MNESVLAVVAGFALWVGIASLWALLAHAHERRMVAKRRERLAERINAVMHGHIPGDM